MVSQLARNLKTNAVKSKWGISISWEGKYKDDMDLELYWYHPNSNSMLVVSFTDQRLLLVTMESNIRLFKIFDEGGCDKASRRTF